MKEWKREVSPGRTRTLWNQCVLAVKRLMENITNPVENDSTAPEELPERRWKAAVIVLADIGLSPRMQFHAISLARQASLEVDVVCYGGTDPHSAILESRSIHLHKMGSVPLQDSSSILSHLKFILKVVSHFLLLLWFILFKIRPPDVFIVQNPPVPALLVLECVSWIRQSTLIVDWHNIGYNQYGFSHKRFPTWVKIHHWFEKHLGRMADGALCATKAMQQQLAQDYGIKAEVVYDRSHEIFHPATLKEKHDLFLGLKNDLRYSHGIHNHVRSGKASVADNGKDKYANDTLLAIEVGGKLFERTDRPAIIVTSISWTRDKNFSTLLEAAVIYDRCAASVISEDTLAEQEFLYGDINGLKKNLYPKVLFLIIVRGPKRQKCEEVIKRTYLKYVAFRLVWLPTDDYQILLGSADLGVCLHTSSSGLDLPVMVADMFGCGLPVCAASFPCIEELIDVWKDGLIFSSASNLVDSLLTLLRGFPHHCDALKLMRVAALAKASSTKWNDEWEKQVKPVIEEVVLRGSKAGIVYRKLWIVCRKLEASIWIRLLYLLWICCTFLSPCIWWLNFYFFFFLLLIMLISKANKFLFVR